LNSRNDAPFGLSRRVISGHASVRPGATSSARLLAGMQASTRIGSSDRHRIERSFALDCP
jgi:hypothetical protein